MKGKMRSIIKLVSPSSKLPIMLNTSFDAQNAKQIPSDKENQFLALLMGEVQLAIYLFSAYSDILQNVSDSEVEDIFVKGENYRDKLSFFLKVKHKQNLSDKEIGLLSIRLHRKGIKASNMLGLIERQKITGSFNDDVYKNNLYKNYYNDPNMLAVIMSNNSNFELKEHRKSIKSIELTPIMLNGEIFDIDTNVKELNTLESNRFLSIRQIGSKKDIQNQINEDQVNNPIKSKESKLNIESVKKIENYDMNRDDQKIITHKQPSIIEYDKSLSSLKKSISPPKINDNKSSHSRGEIKSKQSFVNLSRSPPTHRDQSLKTGDETNKVKNDE